MSELHGEIVTFLRDQQSTVAKYLADKFEDSDFLLNLAYLADIFCHKNELNVSIQGAESNKLGADAKVEAFKNTVSLWKRRALRIIFGSFPTLDGRLGDNETNEALIQCIPDRLKSLEEKLNQYFSAS